MQLLFRSLLASEMERPPTQRDQFDNDEVELVDALVRESIQNSLDARDGTGAVRVNFATFSLEGQARDDALQIIHAEELNPHLAVVGLPEIPRDATMSVLTVEDFGTTGLTGSWNEWDERPFCDFWRRMGRSHKGGQSLGRWGLGKLVFSSVSKARVFLGLTIRADDQEPLLMGQAVLTHHRMPDGKRLDSHAFYGLMAETDIQIPERDTSAISLFKALFRLQRTTEPGLSIVVPMLRENISSERIIKGVLGNYFFPILFGRLSVKIEDTLVDASSYAAEAAKHDPEKFGGGRLAAFISSMKASRDAGGEPPIELPADWTKKDMDLALGSYLEPLREALNAGQIVQVRAPIFLKRKDGTEIKSFVDAFLQRAPDDVKPLFVRGAIVLNAEQKSFRGHKIFAALIADDKGVSEFLGDAENPAHTGWSANAEKVAAKWRGAGDRLREIRRLLQRVHDALISAVETTDRNALVNVFSVAADDGAREATPRGEQATPPVVPPIPPKPRSFSVARLEDGFSIRSGALTEEDIPLTIRVKAAYDVMRGNPFKKHSQADFDFGKRGLSVEAVGAKCAADGPNTLVIEASRTHFIVNVRGFDQNRDLIIQPERVS